MSALVACLDDGLWGTRARPVKPRSQQGFRCWRPRAEIILQVVTQKG